MTERPTLGKLLELWRHDASKGDDFWTCFFTDNVYLLSAADGHEGERMMEEGETIQLVNWLDGKGNEFIPVFTSLEELQRSISGENSYMAINGGDFLEFTRGASICVDPRSEYGVLYGPEDVASILNHFQGERVTVEKATQVMLGAPAEQPVQMIDAIVSTFKNDPRVHAAYFCMMYSGDHKSFVIGIVFKPGMENKTVFDKAGAAAKNRSFRHIQPPSK